MQGAIGDAETRDRRRARGAETRRARWVIEFASRLDGGSLYTPYFRGESLDAAAEEK